MWNNSIICRGLGGTLIIGGFGLFTAIVAAIKQIMRLAVSFSQRLVLHVKARP